MSEAPNVLVELSNEYRRLQRQLEAKTQQLNNLLSINSEAGDFPIDFDGAKDVRYSVDLVFQTKDDDTLPLPQDGAVAVRSGTIFRCAYVESFVRAVGTADDPFDPTQAITGQVTLPWDLRLAAFDFLWTVRDTGTDREWCNRPQPSLFFGGGYVGGLWLPRATILGGGTNIVPSLTPIVCHSTDNGYFNGGTISEYIVQMSFVGHEIPDESAT